MTFIQRLPRIAVTALITLAMINLLIGVILRYVVAGITNYMDWDSVPFTWVEEVGEMALAWLTLIGAAIGIRSRSHFTLHFITPLLSRRDAAGDRYRQPPADRRHWRTGSVVRLGSVQAQLDADDAGSGDQPRRCSTRPRSSAAC